MACSIDLYKTMTAQLNVDRRENWTAQQKYMEVQFCEEMEVRQNDWPRMEGGKSKR